jgi:hypothetical protein
MHSISPINVFSAARETLILFASAPHKNVTRNMKRRRQRRERITTFFHANNITAKNLNTTSSAMTQQISTGLTRQPCRRIINNFVVIWLDEDINGSEAWIIEIQLLIFDGSSIPSTHSLMLTLVLTFSPRLKTKKSSWLCRVILDNKSCHSSNKLISSTPSTRLVIRKSLVRTPPEVAPLSYYILYKGCHVIYVYIST